jgi:hypothetical protein
LKELRNSNFVPVHAAMTDAGGGLPGQEVHGAIAGAGQRLMESITRFITQELKLKVNATKSAVALPQERKFLGFSFSAGLEVKRV